MATLIEVQVQSNTVQVSTQKIEFDQDGNVLPPVRVTKSYSRKNDLIRFVDYDATTNPQLSCIDMMYKDEILARFAEGNHDEQVTLNGMSDLGSIRDFIGSQMFKD